MGLVGNEGMVGFPLILGVGVSASRPLVRGGGQALRMRAALFRMEFNRIPGLQRSLFRYSHALITQISQTAACSRYHDTAERLARRLLMTRDRIGADELLLTQEFLAQMLGVRRVGVTEAAGTLKRQQLIAYSLGKLRILDVAGLRGASCSCYRPVNAVFSSVQH